MKIWNEKLHYDNNKEGNHKKYVGIMQSKEITKKALKKAIRRLKNEIVEKMRHRKNKDFSRIIYIYNSL